MNTTDVTFWNIQLADWIRGWFCLFYEQVPLAWLLGSMVATSIAAVSGLQVETYKPLTPWARCVLGAMVGTGFDAVTINEFLSYWTYAAGSPSLP